MAYTPRFPITRLLSVQKEPHLYDLSAAYNGVLDRREKFLAAKTEIEERGRNGVLGPVGVRDALRELAADFSREIEHDLKPLVSRVRKHADGLKEKLVKRTVRPSPDADTAVRAALAEDRMIRRYEAMKPEQQREALRTLLADGDQRMLRVLSDEPGLLPDAVVKSVRTELMKSRPEWPQYTELVGQHDQRGDVDPLTSPLTVAEMVVNSAADWARREVGVEQAGEEKLKAAGVNLNGDKITLSVEQSKDVAMYRSAREIAAHRSVPLEIAGDEGTGEIGPDAA
jgi:hypothetical protein